MELNEEKEDEKEEVDMDCPRTQSKIRMSSIAKHMEKDLKVKVL